MTDLLATHRRLLERFRRSMNLVGPGPLDEHYQDCAEALAGLRPQGTWADLGSGAGFPGIPFAAAFPGVSVLLVDSRRKRCSFLEQVLLEAGSPPGLRVRCARVEELPDAALDGVLARAFGPWPEVLAHAERLLRPGGLAVLLHAASDEPRGPAWEPVSRRVYAPGPPPRAVTSLRRLP